MWKLWQIGTVFGIPLRIHGTFVLLLAFYAGSGWFQGGASLALLNLGLGLVIFSVVVLHELGHLAAYRRYGMQARDIILSPLGGVARGLGATRDPKQEFVIAVAGPAVNVVLAAVAYGAAQVLPWSRLGEAGPLASALTAWFWQVNLFLLLFNLIPALPMDGGRMLRAVLSLRMGHLKATQVAAKIARWMTLFMAFYGLWSGHLMVLLIAAMVFVMSWMELAQAHLLQASHRSPLGTPGGGFAAPPWAGQVVDQDGRPIGGAGATSPTGEPGWTVRTVRWLE